MQYFLMMSSKILISNYYAIFLKTYFQKYFDVCVMCEHYKLFRCACARNQTLHTTSIENTGNKFIKIHYHP